MDKLKRRSFLQMCVASVIAPTVLQTLTKASAGPVTELEVSKEAVAVLQPDPHETYVFMYKGYAFQRNWYIPHNCYQLYMEIGNYFNAQLIDPDIYEQSWEICCDNMIRAVKRYFNSPDRHRERVAHAKERISTLKE